MEENPKWKGVFSCPDFRVKLNYSPPFKFKCTGLKISRKASADFYNEVRLRIAQTN